MTRPAEVIETPWDSKAFGIPTFEIKSASEAAFEFAASVPGHYTVRIDPLQNSEILHRFGFYYCDTLIEPFATKVMFAPYPDERIEIVPIEASALEALCRHAFSHGRFHRDPLIDNELADQRYLNWLKDIREEGEVFGLTCNDRLAAFFACKGPAILLHAVSSEFRGKGLAKYLWSKACMHLFEHNPEIHSSVSAANLAVVNLYASLGFRFRSATDIYHKLTS